MGHGRISLDFVGGKPVPFTLKEAIDRELLHLEGEGILHRTDHISKWAAPWLAVPKNEGQVDFVVIYIKSPLPSYSLIEADQYPPPKPDNILYPY